MSDPVIIAGGGIGGMAMALTLHQIGVPCHVLETSRAMRPLGVGINIQPNAVRELFELGITRDDMRSVGISVKEWALLGLNGKEVHAEPRGTIAGYKWPQFAAHRGSFLMMLYDKVIQRLGSSAVTLGAKVTGYQESGDGGVDVAFDSEAGPSSMRGRILIGADGIHSAIRAQMHPQQPAINWGGAILWRGTVRAKPLRTGSSFVGLGTHKHRMVIYPISDVDTDGLATINWIAEVTVDDPGTWPNDSWFRPVKINEFVDQFAQFRYDWLDVPAMLRAADCSYENPMIDRDPVPTWVEGPVALMGDAAHAMYPTGSNGASQAIIDARVIGAKILKHGVNARALAAYNEDLCGPISQLVLRNRDAGPFGLLNLLEDRCGGVFDNIDDVIPRAERTAFMAKYKDAAGFAMKTLNEATSIVDLSQTP